MAEQETEDKAAGEAAFAEGFDDDTAQVRSAPAEPPPAEQPNPEKPADPPAPEYVQITKADFERLMTSVNDTDAIKKQLRDVNGRMGNVQQLVKQLQDSTPAGEPVEMSEEDAAEMAADFPELAGMLRTAVNRVLKRQKVKGTGEATPPATQTVDREQWKKDLVELREQTELAALDELHPDWRTIVGKEADTGNPYRQWLATQPEEYQRTINNTKSALVVSRSIDKFEAARTRTAATPTPPPRPPKQEPSRVAARTDRIRGAVQPQGGGGTAPRPTTKTAEDYFEEGFQAA